MKLSTLKKLTKTSLLVGLLALAGAAQAAPKTLRELTEETAGRQAYGLYMRDQKVGWMVYESKLETRASGDEKKELAMSRMELRMQIGRGIEQIVMTSATTNYYSLEGDGELVYAEETSLENGIPSKHTGRPQAGKPGQLLVLSQRDGKEVARRTMTTRDNGGSALKFFNWITSKPAKGAKFTTYALDLGESKDVVADVTYQTAKTISWGGVPTEIFSVDMKMMGLSTSIEVKSNGWPIKARYGGLFDLRAEEEAQAKKFDGPEVDLLAASLIKTNKELSQSTQLDRLKIEFTGLGDFKLPAHARQKVLAQAGDKTTVLIQREDITTAATPLTAAQRTELLAATLVYQQTDAIKNLAKSIIKDETDPVQKADLLQHWVYRNLRKTMAANASTAGDVLKSRAGDCTEHSMLFVALARSAGLPTRQVAGIMYAGGPGSPIFGWHAWAQIHDGTGWVSIDPTWNQVRVDATHIEFSIGENDWAWINVLGSLGIKILD